MRGLGLKGILLVAFLAIPVSGASGFNLQKPPPLFPSSIVVVSEGVALLPSVMRLLVIEEGRIRIFDLNGRQIGLSIPTRGRVGVAVFSSRIIITDEGRIRIFNPNGSQQGTAIRIRRPPLPLPAPTKSRAQPAEGRK